MEMKLKWAGMGQDFGQSNIQPITHEAKQNSSGQGVTNFSISSELLILCAWMRDPGLQNSSFQELFCLK